MGTLLKLFAYLGMLAIIMHKVWGRSGSEHPRYKQLDSILGPVYQRLRSYPIVSNRPALALGLFFFAVLIVAGSFGHDVGGSGSTTAKEKEAPDTKTVEVGCKHVDRSFEVECGLNEECVAEGTQMVCPQFLVDFYPTESKTVNNWERDGHWAGMKGKLTVFSLDIAKASERKLHHDIVGKPKPSADDNFIPVDVIHAYDRAAIMLFGDVPGLTSKKGITRGLGYFRGYKQGFMQDDMYMQVAEFLSEEQYATLMLTQGLTKASAAYKSAELNNTRLDGEPAEQFLDVVSQATDALGEAMVRTLIRVDDHAYEDVVAAGQAAAASRIERATPKLEASPYLRLTEIGFPWNEDFKKLLDDGEWSLPTRSRCGKDAPGDDEAEKKENAANRDYYRQQILSRYFVVPLVVGETGDFDTDKKGFPITAHFAGYSTLPFSLSGKVKIKKESLKTTVCCDVFGNCQSRIFGCKSHERSRTRSMGTSYSYKDELEKRTFYLKDESEVPNKPLGVEGTAVIKIEKVTRICAKNESQSPRYTGTVAGIQFTDEGNVLHSETKVEIPVEEALKGRDAWLSGKLGAL